MRHLLSVGVAVACFTTVINTSPAQAAPPVVSGPARVIDGDTVIVAGTTVRLKGVDASELGTARGEEARGVMVTIVTGPLTCRLTGEKTHRREVGYCTTADGTDINRAIIAKGAALACPRYDDRYVPFEQPAALAAQPRSSYCVERPAPMPLVRFNDADDADAKPRRAGGVCRYPDDLDRAGRRCGARAASVRPGGR